MRSRSHSILGAAVCAALSFLPLAAQTDTDTGATPAAEIGPAAMATAPAPRPLTASATQFEFIPLRHIFFAHNESVLDERARQVLDDAVLYLKYATGIDRVIINGHADYTDSDAYNDQLSDRRTAVVRDYLLAQGIAANLLYTGGLGEHTPIDENWTRDGRARNRRVEIYVVRHAALP
jgi:OOP family OmpA-OmpF porin